MLFYPSERLAVFIDGMSLYNATRALRFDVDYKELLTVFAKHGILVRIFYYTGVVNSPAEEYSPLKPLLDWLAFNGYTVIAKPFKEVTNGVGQKYVKGDIAVDLAVDAMEFADAFDHMILFSGDGDFKHLIEALQRKGKRVSVASTVKADPKMIGDDLRRQADNFIEIDDLRDQIEKEPAVRKPAP